MDADKPNGSTAAEIVAGIFNSIEKWHVLLAAILMLPVVLLFSYFTGTRVSFWEIEIVPLGPAAAEQMNRFQTGDSSFISMQALVDIAPEKFNKEMTVTALQDTLRSMLRQSKTLSERLVQDRKSARDSIACLADSVAMMTNRLQTYRDRIQNMKYKVYFLATDDNRFYIESISAKLEQMGLRLAPAGASIPRSENIISYFSSKPEARDVAERVRHAINQELDLGLTFSLEPRRREASNRQNDILIELKTNLTAEATP